MKSLVSVMLISCLLPSGAFALPHTAPLPAWSQLMRDMDTMNAAMSSIQPSGNDDEDFIHLMLAHHRSALDMAKTELRYGSDPQARRLAEEIVADQQSEVGVMELWLSRRKSALGKSK